MSEEKLEEDNSFTKEVIDFFKDLVIIVIVVKIITVFFISIFIINGQSMYPSYYDKEFILVDRFSLNTFAGLKEQNIKRGDVIVFKPMVDPSKEFFIKRVIGKGGDTVKIVNGKVYLKKKGEKDFVFLDEKYLNKENYGHTLVSGQTKEKIYKIPEGKYFAMGDNRNHSSDARSCFSMNCNGTRDNYIGGEFIIGKVLLDFGYFNFSNFSFTHPGSDKYQGIKGIDTSPKWTSSADSYNY